MLRRMKHHHEKHTFQYIENEENKTSQNGTCVSCGPDTNSMEISVEIRSVNISCLLEKHMFISKKIFGDQKLDGKLDGNPAISIEIRFLIFG